MELSINAIIMIVIGLLVIGLGLGLVNGVLSFGGDSLAQAVEGYRLDVPASSGAPLVASDPLELERGKANVVFTNFYNKNTASCDDSSIRVGTWMSLDCPGINFQRIQTQVIDIPISSQEAVGMVIDVPQGFDAGNYPCTLHVYCEERGSRTQNGLVNNDPQIGSVESKAMFVRVI